LSTRLIEESAEDYVRRISSTIPRNEIAGVLATSNDPFYAEAMRLYMTKFDFTHQPLDIALRQLLMHMSLPKETQQIDRVVEAFAVRYEQCEPGLFKDKG
jgi:Sec7-like guanine-nucleotide exchange factor